MSWTADAPTTPAAPWASRITTACQIRSVSVRTSTPHANDASMNTTCDVWMSLRQSERSARAPMYTENSRYGTQCPMTAKPHRAAEWNFWKITQ